MGLANEGTGKLFRRSEKAVESFEEHFYFCPLCIHSVLLPVSWNKDREGLVNGGSGSGPGGLREGLNEDRDSGDRVERTHQSHTGGRESRWGFLLDESQRASLTEHVVCWESPQKSKEEMILHCACDWNTVGEWQGMRLRLNQKDKEWSLFRRY